MSLHKENISFFNKKSIREDRINEAIRIIDVARKKDAILRLIGGLAVRNHCEIIDFCERDYGDIDLVGLKKHFKKINETFKELGYTENRNVAIATSGQQMQFYKKDLEDHVDVFLDTFRMEHDVVLKDRLTLEDYTISISDILITKLQIYTMNEKDLRDILTIVKDVSLDEEDKSGVINVKYIAQLCAKDWGLYTDIISNINKCLNLMHHYNLSPEEVKQIQIKLKTIKEMIENEPKTRRWKLRAKIGKKKSWYRVVEEEGAIPISLEEELEKRKN
ncbi:hypothetical protein [Candidatus Borrarchaeum sp.]|uniref:hypothetical protein n=1 Tax=Candidatus Borrarchaeum sp. TaxID=2846742 RepID=UPI00257A7A47|nr:hypothetical protein [Candidatus Borrarchaeum sp.]